MRYSLTQREWYDFWISKVGYQYWKSGTLTLERENRIKYWNEEIFPRYKLQYYETAETGIRGYVEGDDKYVNWFIMKL